MVGIIGLIKLSLYENAHDASKSDSIFLYQSNKSIVMTTCFISCINLHPF